VDLDVLLRYWRGPIADKEALYFLGLLEVQPTTVGQTVRVLYYLRHNIAALIHRQQVPHMVYARLVPKSRHFPAVETYLCGRENIPQDTLHPLYLQSTR